MLLHQKMREYRDRAMSVTALKILAVVLMIVDHVGAFIPDAPIWFRWLGRISAPIFIFCITQAVRYTTNRKRYLTRLFLFSLMTTFIFYIAVLGVFCMTGKMHETEMGLNVTGLLFQGALLISIIEMVRNREEGWKGKLAIYCVYQLIMMFLAKCIIAWDGNWGYELWITGPLSSITFSSVLWIVLFLVFYYSDRKVLRNYVLYCIVFFAVKEYTLLARIGVRLRYYQLNWLSRIYEFIGGEILNLNVYKIETVNLLQDCQWMMIFAVIPLFFYNKKYGKGFRKFFYIIYPVHILILYFINLCYY